MLEVKQEQIPQTSLNCSPLDLFLFFFRPFLFVYGYIYMLSCHCDK